MIAHVSLRFFTSLYVFCGGSVMNQFGGNLKFAGAY